MITATTAQFYVEWNNGTKDVIEAESYEDAAFIADYELTNDYTVKATTIRLVS